MCFFICVICGCIFHFFPNLQSKECDEKIHFSKNNVLPLFNEERFTVWYAFEGEELSSVLKKSMIEHFKKIGEVCLSDHPLSEEQQQKKQQPGGVFIKVNASQIVEELETNKRLPVFEIKMELISGVQLSNGSQAPVMIWEKTLFVSVKEKEQFKQESAQSLNHILDLFHEEYRQANPQQEKKPLFFFYF